MLLRSRAVESLGSSPLSLLSQKRRARYCSEGVQRRSSSPGYSAWRVLCSRTETRAHKQGINVALELPRCSGLCICMCSIASARCPCSGHRYSRYESSGANSVNEQATHQGGHEARVIDVSRSMPPRCAR